MKPAHKLLLLVVLLLGLVQWVWAANARSAFANNMSTVAKALELHQDLFKVFPTNDICDPQGKPLLSWRVRLLPFIDQGALYKEFRLDESWDSPHNWFLLSKNPPIYRSLWLDDGDKTWLVALRGPSTFFGDGKTRRRPQDIRNDPATTVVLVEANPQSAPIWSKPDDPVYDPRNPHHGLARTWLAGFFREPSAMVVLADGKMRFIPASTDPEVLRTLFSIEKGEPLRLQLPWYAVLDRPSHRTLILGCLLISLALVAASVGVVCRLYRNKTVWPAEMLLFIIGTQQFFFLFAFFAAYQFEVLPALPPGIQREGLMLRVMPAFAGAFAALCALLQFGEVKRQRAWFGLLVLVLTAFFLASWSVDRSWTAEESLTTIGCPITMALAALVFAAVTPRQSTSTPGKGTWHWLSLIAALVPMVWFGLWWHWGLVEPRVPFLLVLD